MSTVNTPITSERTGSSSPLWVVLTLVVFAVFALLACDRDDDRSPPVTVGTAPGTSQPADELEEPEPPPKEHAPSEDGDDRVDYDPELPAGTEEQRSIFTEARTAFLLDEYERAEELFRQLAFDEPVTGETVSSAIALGQIYIETGRPEEALDLFTELQDHVSQFPEVLFVLARVYADLDYPGLALEAYDKAYEQQPDYVFILPEMAQLLIVTEQEEKAAQLLMRYEERLERMARKLEDYEQTEDEMRIYLVDIIGLLDDDRAYEALQKALLADPLEPVRAEAATALGELAAFDAEDALRRAATEDDAESVRVAARHSLRSLRDLRREIGMEQ